MRDIVLVFAFIPKLLKVKWSPVHRIVLPRKAKKSKAKAIIAIGTNNKAWLPAFYMLKLSLN